MSRRPRPRSAAPRTPPRPRPRPRPRGRRTFALLLAALLIGVSAVACAAAFDPNGPCTADGTAPGAYPELEAAAPKLFRGAAPSQLDSGRTCTEAGLGTLSGHAVKELRFAGATWSTGNESGISLAVFAEPSGATLDPAWIAEFYEAGARAGKNVTSVETTDYAVSAVQVGDPTTGRRVDVLNGESYQTVVIWKRGDVVAAAVIASAIREIQTKEAHEAVVKEAVDAFGIEG